ncbi:hypothetical protein PF001_g4747 [Phytophthora fragariae]|uniref:No apical meristem-associated C-terminal domain-containing protein n=1 Tax=Phytophthora fragariae TaxID=53985 RepID=A0A6A4E8S6_9STRA|nr:hypothetical protein PF001_g4747 [Phytophthora fragariae]
MLYVLPDSAHRFKISIDTEDQLAKNRMLPPKDGRKATLRGPNWDHSEDKALVKAWLVVSKDGITSTDQKGDDFWERVAAKYNELRPRRHERFHRPQNSVAKRWQLLRLAVGKFCGCIASINQLNESGKSAEDRVDDALELYEKIYDDHFDFLEAWRVLRDEPKWKELPDASGGTSSRKRSSSRSSVTQSVRQAPANESRAVGVKRQKQQRTLEESNGRIADAAVVMAKSSQRKAQLEEKRLALLREREQNRIIFASLDGLDDVSLNIIRLKKENISRELQQGPQESQETFSNWTDAIAVTG